MGKRSRKEKDEEYIKKKIRKLQEKLREIPEKNPDTPPTIPSRSPSPPAVPIEREPEPGPSNHTPITDPELITEEELPEEYLLALGTEGAENTEAGDPIRQELTVRWSRIMSDGLGKEAREAILKKYPAPSNFPRAQAPALNAEIAASLSEISVKRDKRIIYRQNMLGKLMSCLGKSLTAIMKGNINSKLLIEEIHDAAKIAADIHQQDSSSRKFFALSGANKNVQEAVRDTKIDQFLFGADCAEKIKAAQALQRTGSQIKATQPDKFNQAQNTSIGKKVNWKGPPQFQQARGGRQIQQRQPAYKRQRFNQSHHKQHRPPPSRPRSRHHR